MDFTFEKVATSKSNIACATGTVIVWVSIFLEQQHLEAGEHYRLQPHPRNQKLGRGVSSVAASLR